MANTLASKACSVKYAEAMTPAFWEEQRVLIRLAMRDSFGQIIWNNRVGNAKGQISRRTRPPYVMRRLARTDRLIHGVIDNLL